MHAFSDVTDDSGNTPLNGAIDNDHTEVVKYLNSRPLPSAQPGSYEYLALIN